MSCVIVLAPALAGIALPILAAAAGSVAGAMGFHFKGAGTAAAAEASKAVCVELKNGSDLAETLGLEETLTMEKEGVTVLIRRSVGGKAMVEARGTKPDKELKAIGEEVANRLVQACVRARVEAEAKDKGYRLVEDTQKDGTIHLRFEKRG
jgi:hypothetical protein